MEWIVRLFSGEPGDMRYVNIAGLVLMALGTAASVLARRLAGDREKAYLAIKVGGMLLVMLGALVAMKII